MRKMTIGSLFDGSGGFPLAGCMCGMEPLWASEVEPYPIAVTKARFPKMKHLGDVQKINGAEIDPVDVITFGSPCQDMSIAGKRAGLRHEENGDDRTTRSGLFIEAIRIIREMRQATNGKYPAFAVWENVPGAFSSNGGADFKTVLEELASAAQGERVSVPFPEKRRWLNAGEIVGDGFSIAWRVLDAQYWGVPQRRKRIYLVADFAGGRAGKILFERESGGGNPEPGEEARQGAADHAAGGAGGSDRVECLNPWDCQSKRQYTIDGAYTTLNAGQAQSGQAHGICYEVAAFMGGQGSKAGGLGYAEEVAPTLKSAISGGNTVPDVVYAINDKATRNRGGGPTRHDDGAGNGLGVQDDGAMYTLDTASKHAVCYPEIARCLTARYDGSPCADRGPDVVAIDCRNLNANIEISGTLQAKTNGGQSLNFQNPVVYSSGAFGSLSEGVVYPHVTGALCANSHPGGCTGQDAFNDMLPVVLMNKPSRKYIVRRITPLECCRLQGFPDGWGDIPLLKTMKDADAKFWGEVRRTYARAMGKAYKPFKDQSALVKWYNKLHTDSAEYKMWGNGIALPCAVFVMHGIAECVSEME